jgi:hypothetical protein
MAHDCACGGSLRITCFLFFMILIVIRLYELNIVNFNTAITALLMEENMLSNAPYLGGSLPTHWPVRPPWWSTECVTHALHKMNRYSTMFTCVAWLLEMEGALHQVYQEQVVKMQVLGAACGLRGLRLSRCHFHLHLAYKQTRASQSDAVCVHCRSRWL